MLEPVMLATCETVCYMFKSCVNCIEKFSVCDVLIVKALNGYVEKKSSWTVLAIALLLVGFQNAGFPTLMSSQFIV